MSRRNGVAEVRGRWVNQYTATSEARTSLRKEEVGLREDVSDPNTTRRGEPVNFCHVVRYAR